jgi:hypothetical protein
MRFMLLIIPGGYENGPAGGTPCAKTAGAMMDYNRSLQEAGVLLGLDSLHPPSMGARVEFWGGRPKAISGPFPGVREEVGGYWMIDVESKEEAVEWAGRCPASDNEVIEVRQVQELAGFPSDARKAAGFPDVWSRTGET